MLGLSGLHDYNLGVAGVPEYTAEYKRGLAMLLNITDTKGAKVFIVGTTPAHNTATPARHTHIV